MDSKDCRLFSVKGIISRYRLMKPLLNEQWDDAPFERSVQSCQVHLKKKRKKAVKARIVEKLLHS